MATLTIRNLPDELIERLKASAKAGNRSMEQEVRELLEARYQKKSDLIKAIRNSWKELPETSAKDIESWRHEGRP
ncbi:MULTISPECIES: FitA-like ribbon-helix-helix domain-containing protein [unclassified Endozoicomonas]|uniref:FitA-like ribbon-helix-helix domain-containing protein n=1 Tax=unclassified Endozoicomonas TaxID=2644528 RepID=UPI003BB587DD